MQILNQKRIPKGEHGAYEYVDTTQFAGSSAFTSLHTSIINGYTTFNQGQTETAIAEFFIALSFT